MISVKDSSMSYLFPCLKIPLKIPNSSRLPPQPALTESPSQPLRPPCQQSLRPNPPSMTTSGPTPNSSMPWRDFTHYRTPPDSHIETSPSLWGIHSRAALNISLDISAVVWILTMRCHGNCCRMQLEGLWGRWIVAGWWRLDGNWSRMGRGWRRRCWD